jgi:hypothetical protein
MVRCAAFGWVVLGITSALPAPDDDRDAETIRFVQYEVPQRNAVPNENGAARNAPQIQIMNDPSSGGSVRFLVDGREHSLQSGSSMTLSADRSHKVEFNSGGTAGDRAFTVSSGVYRFKVAKDGWMLYRSSSAPMAAAGSPPTSDVPPPPAPHPELAKRRIARTGTSAVDGAGRPSAVTPAATDSPPPPAAGIAGPRKRKTSVPVTDQPALKAPGEGPESPPVPPTAELPK